MMDRQVRERARDEIGRILESAAFDVEPMEPPLDLSAIREDECILVMCSNDTAEIEQFDQTVYRVQAHDKEVVCRKLLFSVNDRIAVKDCILWGIPALIDYAGKAACARVLGREMVLELVRPRQAWVGAIPTCQDEETGIPHLPLRLSERDARMLAKSEGAAQLRLIPYWQAHYVSSGGTTYKDHQISFDQEGSIALNAINGEFVTLDDGVITRAELPPGAEVSETHITRDAAEGRMVDYVVRSLTKKVRIRQERRDAIFYEEKVFRPDRKAIRVELSRVFVPVWQVRGRSIVEINGYTGEILSTPMDEGVEIL
ncbi:hypothetical protein DSECCO2_235930 [anaerobic digester metagenome]